MRRFSIVFVLLGLASNPAAIAAPGLARYSDDPSRLFWFVVVADSHIGAGWVSGEADTERLAWVAGEAWQVIEPVMVFDCGDLVDASGWTGIPGVQVDEEWEEYRQILDLAGMTPGRWVDMPGNHDQYGDKGLSHFLAKSIQGSADGQTQHSVVHETPFGRYHFLAVSTAGDDGWPWPADNAGIDEAEMAFVQAALDANAGASLQFAFGHHPLGYPGMPGGGLVYGQGDFRNLLSTRQVLAYFYGHTHAYAAEFHDGVLQLNIDSLGKSDDRHFAIAAVDNDSLAVRVFRSMAWPYVVVTAPADADLGGGNPYAPPVPAGWDAAPVRALVFARDQVQGVEFRVDAGGWAPMAEVAPHVWQGRFDATLLAPGSHEVRVRALPFVEAEDRVRFEVADVPVPEPGPEPGPEPAPEPGPESVPEPVPEPPPDGVAEQAPEAASDSSPEIGSEPMPEVSPGHGDEEPAEAESGPAPAETSPEAASERRPESAGDAVEFGDGAGDAAALADTTPAADTGAPTRNRVPSIGGCGCRMSPGDGEDPAGGMPLLLLAGLAGAARLVRGRS